MKTKSAEKFWGRRGGGYLPDRGEVSLAEVAVAIVCGCRDIECTWVAPLFADRELAETCPLCKQQFRRRDQADVVVAS